jgi:hypothetical protein
MGTGMAIHQKFLWDIKVFTDLSSAAAEILSRKKLLGPQGCTGELKEKPERHQVDLS